MLYTGVLFDSRLAADILGLRASPLAVVLEPKFCTIHDLTFAQAGGRTSVKDDADVSSAPPSRARSRASLCLVTGAR